MSTQRKRNDSTRPATNTGLAALNAPRLRDYRRRYRALRRDALRQPGAQPLVTYIDRVLAELDGALRAQEGQVAA